MLTENPKVHLRLLLLKCFSSLPELTCFTVFEQIKLGRELLPEQHIKPSITAMYGYILYLSLDILQSLIQFVPLFWLFYTLFLRYLRRAYTSLVARYCKINSSQ